MGNNIGYPDKSFFQDYMTKNLILTFPMMNSVMSKNSSDGYLKIDQFNECLKALFTMNIFPQIAYTFLSERLFNLLDIQKKGIIRCEDLTKGICLALSKSETRLNILFNAMKYDNYRNYLVFDDIYNFYLKTWGSGFHYIYNCLNYFYRKECEKSNIPIPNNMNEFNAVIGRHQEDLKNFLLQNLYESGVNPRQNINFEMFKLWAKIENPVIIEYAGKNFMFATSLNFMNYVGLDVNK